MTLERECSTVRKHLDDALLARREPSAEVQHHVMGCAACSAHRRRLASLAEQLEGFAPAPPTPQSAAALAVRVRQELARLHRARTASAGKETKLPQGFRREVARLLVAALAPLPVVLLWNLGVLTVGSELLTGVVPGLFLQVLAVFYVLAASAWLAVLYGAIPFVAHRQVSQRIREVLS